MILWSLPDSVSRMPCAELVHPSSLSCIKYICKMSLNTVKGAAGFFVLYNAVGALRKKLLARDSVAISDTQWKDYLKKFVSFQIFCWGIASGTLTLSCLFRNLLNRYYRLTLITLPAFICSFSICVLDPKTCVLGATLLYNSVFSLIWSRLSAHLRWRVSPIVKTALFMILSSIISPLITVTGNSPSFWFFNPLVQRSDNVRECRHSGSCVQHTLTSFASYFIAGISLSLFKIIFKMDLHLISNSTRFLQIFMRARNLSMAFFLGMYSAIYQSTRCCLSKEMGYLSPALNGLAGCLAGLSFIFNPSNTILNFAIITISQVIIDECKTKKLIPNWRYSVIAFAIAAGFVFDAAFICSDCPSFPVFVINSATFGEGNVIAKSAKKHTVPALKEMFLAKSVVAC